MITKSELKKRQETADKVRDQLGEKAILNGRESDQKHSQYPPELRALARASSGLIQWGSEDRSEDIRLFYEYRDGSCNDRTLDFYISIEKAVLALQNSGKDGLAFRIENKWKKVKEFAEQADDTISVLRRQLINGSIDEKDFSKKVRTAVHLARGTALALGRWMEIVVEQQIENFKSKMLAISGKAGDKNKPQGNFINEAYIKKGRGFGFGGKLVWEFGFGGKKATVDGSLKGLVLIEYLLLHKKKEYTPLELLKAIGQRGEEETEPEGIYSDADIAKIKQAVEGLRGRAKVADNLEKERLEREIERAEEELRKARNCRGGSRKFSNKNRISVIRNIKTVLDKISPQHTELYNHLNTFLSRGEICYYKPDTEIVWNIS